jgi:DNA primase catalytic core
VAIHDLAARFFRGHLAGSWVPGYLAGRGISPEAQSRWQAGYAPAGWDALTRYLFAAGYPGPLIVAAGLARRSSRGTLTDTFRDRAVFPIRSPRGTIVAFIGRAAEHAGPDVPRYLNSPATVLYDKGRALFGLWQARAALSSGAVPVITEGPLDVIAVAEAAGSRYAPVAPCGTAVTAHQVALLTQDSDLAASGVLVAFDGDPAGMRAAVTAYRLLSPLTGRIGSVVLVGGQDPAQILADHGPAVLASILGHCVRPLADLVIDAHLARWERGLRFAEGRIGALRAVAPVIAGLAPADVARQVARLAQRLGLDYPTVTEAVADAAATLAPVRAATSAAAATGGR